MRRSILLALVAALALALGLSNVAVAEQGSGADASAKSGKKSKRGKSKARGCKGKRGKRNGRRRSKAHRSASASAKARNGRKGKGKRRGCRGGGGNWLKIGKYKGEGGIDLEIRSRKRFLVVFPTATTCLTVIGSSSLFESEEAQLTANKLTGGYTAEPDQKGPIRFWSLTVTSNYHYKLVVSSDTTNIGGACSKPGVKFEGKLRKVG